jgi:gamma-tubulin complex component 2
MEKGDFFASFYEQSLRDLRRIISSGRAGSTPTRLGQQLGMVLGSSTTVGSDDPYKEDLRIECTTEKVYTQLMRIAETKGAVEAAKAAKQQKKEQAAQNMKGERGAAGCAVKCCWI